MMHDKVKMTKTFLTLDQSIIPEMEKIFKQKLDAI